MSPKVIPILNWITSANFHFLMWNTGLSQKASKIEQGMTLPNQVFTFVNTHVWTASLYCKPEFPASPVSAILKT